MPTEEEVREDVGLSPKKTKSERGYVEELLRQEIAHPSPPDPFEEREIVDVDAEVAKFPQLGYFVEKDRSEGWDEEHIREMVRLHERSLGIGLEDAVRRQMGVPKAKPRLPVNEVERRVRRSIGTPDRVD